MEVRELVRASVPGRGSNKCKDLQAEARLASLVSDMRKRKTEMMSGCHYVGPGITARTCISRRWEVTEGFVAV